MVPRAMGFVVESKWGTLRFKIYLSYLLWMGKSTATIPRIGSRENLQETFIFHGKLHIFL